MKPFLILESGADVMGALKDREAHHEEEKKLFNCLVDLLSYEKITFNGECQEKGMWSSSKIALFI